MAKKAVTTLKSVAKEGVEVTFEYAGEKYKQTAKTIPEAILLFKDDVGFVKGKGTFTLGKKSTTVAGMRLRRVLNNKIVATLIAKSLI